MGECFDRVEDDQGMRLLAVAARGDVHPEEAALCQCLDELGGDATRVFDFAGAGADCGLQLLRGGDERMLLVLREGREGREGVAGIGHERRVEAHA